MILGIGIDIIEVERIQASYAKFGERFLNRILHPNEINYCLSHRVPGPFLAAPKPEPTPDIRGRDGGDGRGLELPEKKAAHT